MARVTTPPTAQPAGKPVPIPHEKVAMRAYQKWVQRGCTHGHDMQDWVEAEKELRSEMGSPGMAPPRTPSTPGRR